MTQIRKLARARGWRSASYTPLMNQGTCIGFIVCTRRETGMLADHHVQLLRTFADQAVIAIENARLFNETREALERQTATADILKVIASFAVRRAAGVRCHRGQRQPPDRRLFGRRVPLSSTARFIWRRSRRPTTAGDAVLQSSFPAPLDQFPPYQLDARGSVGQNCRTPRSSRRRETLRGRAAIAACCSRR